MNRHDLNCLFAFLWLGFATTCTVQGGILSPPGGTVVYWTDGAANNDWEDPNNWNLHVPEEGDAVIIDTGHRNVWLTKKSEDLRSLYVGSGIALYNFHNKLSVRDDSNEATTRINGNSSGIVVSKIDEGPQQDFNTDYLVITNGAYLRMDGGKAHVDFDVDMSGDVEIRGHGDLEVNGNGLGSALHFSDDSVLRPQGGNLRINMTGGGDIYFGNAFIDVTEENSDLNIDGALSSAIADTLRIGAGNRVDFDHNWEVSGLLDFRSGGGEIVGAPGIIGGELRVDGSIDNARVANQLHFASTSDMSVDNFSTLELGRVSASPGHVSTLRTGSTLRVNIPNSGSQTVFWDGHIDANSANFEVNSSAAGGQTGVFRLNGSMNVGSAFHNLVGSLGPTDLQGSASIYQNGTMSLTGKGGRVLNDGGVRFLSGSSTHFAFGAELEVQSVIRADEGANFSGPGKLVIAETGLMFAEDDAVIDVNVVNHGSLRVGTPFANSSHLQLADNFVQSSSGTLALDLAGSFPWQYDRLIVEDFATIEGTLDVSLAGGFQPEAGDDFLVLDTSSGLTGTFDDTSLPSLAAGLMWETNYSPFELTLSVVECPAGDANCDGTVNGADFLFLQREYGEPAPSPADLTGDGVVTDADIDEWQNQYPAPLVGAVQSVPEPSALTLACLLAVGAVAYRRHPAAR